MNKKIILAGTLVLSCLAVLAAQPAKVVYTEGSTRIKSAAGSLREADFGSTVSYGESVLTGRDGYTELSLPDGSSIRVMKDSVFNYSSTGTGQNTRPVLATTAGQVGYKINRVTGRSPVIQTNSMVAAVRGTEFTVFAGREGSVLIAVDEGIVDVSAQGETIELLADEIVEVEPGKAPGVKYTRLGRELDFSGWNQNRNDDFLADPLAALDRLEAQLTVYRDALFELKAPYAEATAVWEKASREFKALAAKGDTGALNTYEKEVLAPAIDNRSALILNIRYHALNYLGVRRYVLANMYMEVRSRDPLSHKTATRGFLARHAEILDRYEEEIVPELNENDY